VASVDIEDVDVGVTYLADRIVLREQGTVRTSVRVRLLLNGWIAVADAADSPPSLYPSEQVLSVEGLSPTGDDEGPPLF
jgi:hypothetical protein